MNKRGLVAVCAPRLGGRVAAEAAVEAIFDAIVRELVAGGRVVLTGFGTFEAVERKHMDGATAWTNKTCAHCAACATTYLSDTGEREWDTSDALDWLRECHGIEFAGLLAGWRYPDGGLMPPPFERRCVACGVHVPRQQLWCEPCDARRIARIDEQLRALLPGRAS